jgi:DNA-binding transcriptional ArsR family regulator
MVEQKPLIKKFRRAEEERARQQRAELQPQGSRETPLTQFIPPKFEFRDGSIVLKLVDGREEVLPIREFVKTESRELARRLGLEGVPEKAVFMWKREVLQSYLNVQPLRRQVEFSKLEHLWTLAEPILIESEWVDVKREFTVWFARQSFGASTAIVDVDGYVNPRRLSYSLVKADEGLVNRVVSAAPRGVLRKLVSVLEERGVVLEREEGGRRLNEAELRERLAERLLNHDAIFAPAPTLRDAKFLEDIEWRENIGDLLTFGAPVDSRLAAIRAVYALRGVEGRYLPHGIIVGNSGSGKSQFFKVWGQHWDKVTANTLIGYAKGKDEIYPGLIDHAEEVIAVDQVESADRANLTRYLLDYMEDGACSFAAGGISYRQRGLAPLVFIANPIGSGGEKDFQRTLEVVSYNPALGGRIAIVFYFTDLAVIRGTAYALGHEEEERWRQAKAFVRAVEDYCRGRLRAIWRHPKVVEWLKQPIQGYAEKVAEIAKMLNLSNPQLYEFFLNHATQAAPKIRAAALQAALLFNLKDIALGTFSVERILEEAEEWLRRIVELNLASIANIVGEYEGKRELNVRAHFESLPDYLKAVVVVAEAYRRAVLSEYRGRGQVPEELRSVVLEDLKVSVPEFGYRYLSQALDRIKRHPKGASNRFPSIKEYFGVQFTVLEGPEPRVRATVEKWEEAPIPVSERLVREVESVLGKVFLHFSTFSSSPGGGEEEVVNRNPPQDAEGTRGPEEGEKTPPADKPRRNGETGEMEKQEYSPSFHLGKRSNKTDRSSVLHREDSILHQEKTEDLTQAEAAARILEFIGKEGKPLKQVLEYAVKGLGLLKPEPLLHVFLERGTIVKVKKGGETWLVKG